MNAAMPASADLLELNWLTDFEFYFEVTDFGYDVVKLCMTTQNLWILVLKVELCNALHGARALRDTTRGRCLSVASSLRRAHRPGACPHGAVESRQGTRHTHTVFGANSTELRS